MSLTDSIILHHKRIVAIIGFISLILTLYFFGFLVVITVSTYGRLKEESEIDYWWIRTVLGLIFFIAGAFVEITVFIILLSICRQEAYNKISQEDVENP
ncbi:hypothetical protein FO519_006748 [Halicephalobus sp. NKZ332]|nr:hypothetical protein FO519_006748 [Halicephalobus sp. NKZ332]